MDATYHDDGSGTDTWHTTTIEKCPEIYTTCGVLDDDAPGLAGIVSSTHVRGGRIRSPRTDRRGLGYPRPSRAILKEGDLAVVLVRRTGDAAVVTAEHSGWTATRSIGIIRADPHIVRWLRIWLQTPTAKARIDEDVTAHVEPTVSLYTLRRMLFPLPSSDVITRYHRVFTLIEERIGLHQETARKVVELADAIHDDWSSASPAWETQLIGGVTKAKTGKGSAKALAPRTKEPGVDAITPTDVFDLTVPYVETLRLRSPAEPAEVWPPGTFMLSTRPDGTHIVVTQHPASPTRGVVAMLPTDDMDSWWLLHELRSRSDEIAQAAQGRSVREISARALKRLSITWPDPDTRADFRARADPLHAMARQLVSEVATLHDLKDALLRDISAKAGVLLEQEAQSDEKRAYPPSAIPTPRVAATGYESGWPPEHRRVAE